MQKRERNLAVGFAVVLIGAAGYRFVYPGLLKPMFDLSGRISERQDELLNVEQQMGRLEPAVVKYHEYVRRTGSTDLNAVKNDLGTVLTRLIEACGLQEQSSVSPIKATLERGSNIQRLTVTIRGQGPLEAATTFLQRLHEQPYVIRASDLTVSPTASTGAGKYKDEVQVSGTLEALVLPAAVLDEVPPPSGDGPERFVRHEEPRYASIWQRMPFTEWREPVALPPPPEPKPVVERESESEPIGDPDRDDKVLRMTLMYGADEVLIYNGKTKKTEYIAVGGAFDGGTLVLVHPLGAVARRPDGEYVYGIGQRMADGVSVVDAGRFPEITAALASARPAVEMIEAVQPPDAAEVGEEPDTMLIDLDFVGPPPETPAKAPPAATPDDSAKPPSKTRRETTRTRDEREVNDAPTTG